MQVCRLRPVGGRADAAAAAAAASRRVIRACSAVPEKVLPRALDRARQAPRPSTHCRGRFIRKRPLRLPSPHARKACSCLVHCFCHRFWNRHGTHGRTQLIPQATSDAGVLNGLVFRFPLKSQKENLCIMLCSLHVPASEHPTCVCVCAYACGFVCVSCLRMHVRVCD